MKQKLIEGVDYYIEHGKYVFTPSYHIKRGVCCGSRCRHCPYEPQYLKGNKTINNNDRNCKKI